MVSTSITSGRPNRTAVLCGFFNVSGLDIGVETAASAGVVPEVVFIGVVWETGFATISEENDTVSWLSTGDSESTSIESTVMAGLSATSRGWRFGAKYKAVATAPPRTTAETEPTIQYRNGLADPDMRLKFRHAEGL